MKRLIILAVMMAVLCIPVSAFAIGSEFIYSNFDYLGDTWDYASVWDFGGLTIGSNTAYSATHSWQHTLPGDLQVPPDAVDDAVLLIHAAVVETGENIVVVDDLLVNFLTYEGPFDMTYLTLASAPPRLWNGGTLSVGVWAREDQMILAGATFLMNYTKAQPATGATPEPGTLALLGLGLVGLGAMRQARKR